MPTIAFARHCVTDWNLAERIQGHTDIPLNALGIEQANGLAEKIVQAPRFNLRWIVSSDLSRARDTAHAVAQRFTPMLPIKLDPFFRELNFGSLEGTARKELIAVHGEQLFSHAFDAPQDFRSYGGEHRGTVLERQLKALSRQIDELDPLENSVQLLIVGHGRSLGILLDHFKQPYKLKQGDFQLVTL